MSEHFNADKKHVAIGLIFDGAKKQELESNFKIDCYSVKNEKHKELLAGMVVEMQQSLNGYVQHVGGVMSSMHRVKSIEEEMLIALGKSLPSANEGYIICMDCMERSILLLQDQLGMLGDLHKLIKESVEG